MEKIMRTLESAGGIVKVIGNLELLQNLVYGLIAVTILLIIVVGLLFGGIVNHVHRINVLEDMLQVWTCENWDCRVGNPSAAHTCKKCGKKAPERFRPQ